jgi:predicted RNA-binding protein with PUA-like domain
MTNTKDYSDWLKPITEEDKKRYALVEKNYVIEQMARQCEIGDKLVSYWLRSNTKIPEATQFFDACKLVYDENIPAGFLYSAREYWDTRDWRGKKGQLPTPIQLAETAMRML